MKEDLQRDPWVVQIHVAIFVTIILIVAMLAADWGEKHGPERSAPADDGSARELDSTNR